MKHKNYLIPGFVLVMLVSLVISASSLKGGGGGGGPAAQRTISVNGIGKVTMTPDIATINIGVHTENEDVAAALSDNNVKAQAVRDSLTAFGILPADIQTANFSVYQNQVYGPQGEMLGIKYIVDNTVYITVRDLAKMGEVLTTLVGNGANNIYGITFDVANRSAALKEARKAAVADAKAQADELAAITGVTLGEIISINTNTASTQPMYSDFGYGGGGGMMAAAPVPVSSGQLIVTVDAYLSYEIH